MVAPAKIRDFCGYGRLEAELWLIGFEESTGERHQRSDWSLNFEMSVRQMWSRVMDVRDAHEQLEDRYWLGNGYSTVWKYMAKLARGALFSARDWNDMTAARIYVVEQLGRQHGNTFLGEMLPLPSAHRSDWPSLYRTWYSDRDEYSTVEYPYRISMWRDLISKHSPRYVCCYGFGKHGEQWQRYKQVFDGDWQDVQSDRVIKTVCGSTTAYLMPFLGQGQLRLSDIHAIISDIHPELSDTCPPGLAVSPSKDGISVNLFEEVLEGLPLQKREQSNFVKFWGTAGEGGPGFYLKIKHGNVTRVDLSRVSPPTHRAICGPRAPNGQVTAEIDFSNSEESVLEAFALIAERVAGGAQ